MDVNSDGKVSADEFVTHFFSLNQVKPSPTSPHPTLHPDPPTLAGTLLPPLPNLPSPPLRSLLYQNAIGINKMWSLIQEERARHP